MLATRIMTSSKYDDYDWDELPEDVKAAAELLGYTKKIWDTDGKPETHDYDWDDLSEDQKKAAAVFGYDKDKWDGED